MAVLRELGYKTFDGIIDESYDQTHDDSERFTKIFKEIQRLCAFTPEQWYTFQKEVEPIVEHNYKNLQKPKDIRYTKDVLSMFKP